MGRCFSCFKEFDDEYDICPYCGTFEDKTPVEPIHLVPGTVLAGRYILGKAIGSGGFGIIYKAYDCKLETIIAVKEFFVSRIMTRAAGQKDVIVNKKSAQEFEYRKNRFLAEARTMAKFGSHKNIPNVFEFFEENRTAYIVMELLEGQALNVFMQQNSGKVDKDFAIMVAHEVGNALTSLHEQGIIHRDVAPDNIFICTGSELRIKLLDLGAAKLADDSDKAIDIILKPGYSPTEQYDNTNNIGPWTDVYALGATLYVMLTGVKPEESTNRKIEDEVPYPIEIDATISENLSNSVMKAMAVEKHLRFKSVAEFVKAIDGERKIVPVKTEKKRRFRNRLIGIAAACLVLVVVGVGVYKYFESKRAVQILKKADISIWYCADDDSDEKVAMQAVVDDFSKLFPDVTIDLRNYPESEYFEKLNAAAQNGNLPNLFESTDIDASVLSNAIDATNVLKSDQAKNCLFLDQYSNYYSDNKRVPLGIEVPVAYIITNGNTYVDYSGTTFESVSDFGDGCAIAVDDSYSELLNDEFGSVANSSKDAFMDNEENTCAVLISSSMEINNIRSTLTNYEKGYIYYGAKDAKALFTYEWSLGGGTENEVAAAERLLSWMLGNSYQTMLMISRCSDGQIPVNEECFNSKTGLNLYAPLKDTYKTYIFGE